MPKVIIFWFRRDLRLNDNHGLLMALSQGEPVLPLFIFDTNILNHLPDKQDRRVSFLHHRLEFLNSQLKQQNSGLWVEHGDPLTVFQKLAVKFQIKAVFTNHDYEPKAIQRDAQIQSFCRNYDIEFYSFKDQVVFEKDDIIKSDGLPYTVFTPYKNRWLEKYLAIESETYPSENIHTRWINIPIPAIPSIADLGFSLITHPDIEPRIDPFLIEKYDQFRDFPGRDSTTRLGIHLRFGTISIGQLVKIAAASNLTFLSELIWREFFMMILYHFPRVESESFQLRYNDLPWRNDPIEFGRWKDGLTGFPLVDAGMRELEATGFMHNRVRMIAASFLVKNLLIDWRIGEAWFAQKLDDFELASNNGNWQWIAGTGCDAAPYFRVFNPINQLKIFDAQMEYIRRWIPEFGTPSYPQPMIDLKRTRLRALNFFKISKI